MGSVKDKVDKVMNKVADKIMPKEVAKVAPYIAMAAPFLGPVGMLATLPAQALADAKNYGKLNYKKLALQAAMTGIAKAGQSGKALSGEQAFADANPDLYSTTGTAGAPLSPGQSMAMVGDTSLAGTAAGTGPILGASNPMALAEANPAAFETFMETYKPSFGDRVADVITKTGRSMYQPLQFGEDAPSISDQLFNMDRAKQAAFMLGPMTTYAGMDAIDQMEAGQGGGGTATSGGIGAQALYDDFLQSGRLAGYTDEEINTIYGPYGDMAGGDYQTVNVDRGPRRRQFPGTNYNLFTYANGGRAGYAEGDIVSPEQMLDDEELQKKLIMDALFPEGSPGANEDAIADQMLNMQMQEMMSPRMGRAGGGIMQVAPGVPAGMELDYRNTGGFIPMGGPEKADDVPAMLSKNEFVMTADAVRGMGDGDVNRGAQRMYDLMNNMEAKV